MTNCRWVKLCINLQKLLCIVELVSKMLLPSLSATHVFLLEPIKTKKFIYVTINYEDNENILIKYLRKSINYEWRMHQIVSPILQLQIYEFLARKWILLFTRHPVPSTDQALPSCFYFRISWILMEPPWKHFFGSCGFLQGLRRYFPV